ncbi:MAG: tRNA 2-thiouridine(34) synthase MnmA [Alphaproteobacteria bacterium]|jgi:tRNA-specific 2-thiouridylase|nr:tRNA 2-thiouridine(34) synthase MnmA [Alphaproteobacteria bacterium]
MIDFEGVDKNARIVVALSGGVDSSTTIALLKEAGYKNVVGMTLLLHENNLEKGIISKDQNVRADCTRVAETLGIEHHFVDIKDLFMQEIINPFLESYLHGITFNPCIKCNRVIKFGKMLSEAQKLNADILTTGHYIKWGVGNDGKGAIYRGKNDNRDQSYFLSQVKKEALQYIRFPLYSYNKDQVRAEAARLGIHVAQKKSSADICFAGIGSYNDILKTQGKEIIGGDIVDVKGNVLGRHDGIHNYTVGQRKGVGVGGMHNPLYVMKIDAENHKIIVGNKEDLQMREIFIEGVNWLGDGEFDFTSRVLLAKVRGSQQLKEAEVFPLGDGKARVVFKENIFGVASGQICAFYDEERLLGGGYI